MRPAVRRPVAGRLALADRDRAAVRAGRLEHAERHQVDVRDRRARRPRSPPRRARARARGSRGSSAAGRARPPRRPTPRRARPGSVTPSAVRHLDDLEAEARRVGLHDLAHLRVQRLGENDLASGRCACFATKHGVGGDRRAVVAGRVGHVHPGQLADHRLVLEDRLQHALAHLRLVRRVRGQELAAREDDVDDRRDVVVVDPGAEERELRARVDVPRASSSRCRTSSASPSAGGTSSSRSKRTPGGICSKSSSIDETPIAASISSRSASVRLEVAAQLTARRRAPVRLGVHAARRPRTGRTGGSG